MSPFLPVTPEGIADPAVGAAQVRRVRAILEGPDPEVATADGARAMLSLEGGRGVGS